MNKNILISALAFLVVLVGGYFLVAGGSSSDASGSGSASSETAGEGVSNSAAQSTDKPATGVSTSNGSPDKDADELLVGESGLPSVRYVEIEAGTLVESVEQAQQVVDQQSAALGIEFPASLAVVDNTEDGLGNSYYQIDQYYSEIPVYGASALLEVQNNEAGFLSGIWEDNIELVTEPTYSAEEALTIAANNLGSTQETSLEFLGQPTLVIYISNLDTHLAWHMKARIFAGSDYEELIVDAHNPNFLLQVSLELH